MRLAKVNAENEKQTAAKFQFSAANSAKIERFTFAARTGGPEKLVERLLIVSSHELGPHDVT